VVLPGAKPTRMLTALAFGQSDCAAATPQKPARSQATHRARLSRIASNLYFARRQVTTDVPPVARGIT
jgi:hypothetical protein